MTTVTTTEIQNRLQKSFNNVEKITMTKTDEVKEAIKSASMAMNSWATQLDGVDLCVVIYTNSSEQAIKDDTADYNRAVIIGNKYYSKF